MKHCPFCGEELQSGAAFCTSCGKRIPPAETGAAGGGYFHVPSFQPAEKPAAANAAVPTPRPIQPAAVSPRKTEALGGYAAPSAVTQPKKKKALLWVIPVIALLAVAAILAVILLRDKQPEAEQDKAAKLPAQSVLFLELYDRRGNIVGTGSGFLIKDGVTLVTNYHVIDGVYRIRAYTADGEDYTRADEVLAFDRELDLAILRCEDDLGCRPIPLGDSDKVEQGDKVVAIGYPLGQANTLSDGVVSALYRNNGVDVILTTAPISSGSSGGVLLDEDGKAIGVTAATYVDGQNMNIVIPIKYVKKLPYLKEPVDLSELDYLD